MKERCGPQPSSTRPAILMTIRISTCRVCGTNPSTFERKRATGGRETCGGNNALGWIFGPASGQNAGGAGGGQGEGGWKDECVSRWREADQRCQRRCSGARPASLPLLRPACVQTTGYNRLRAQHVTSPSGQQVTSPSSARTSPPRDDAWPLQPGAWPQQICGGDVDAVVPGLHHRH